MKLLENYFKNNYNLNIKFNKERKNKCINLFSKKDLYFIFEIATTNTYSKIYYGIIEYFKFSPGEFVIYYEMDSGYRQYSNMSFIWRNKSKVRKTMIFFDDEEKFSYKIRMIKLLK